MKYLICFLLSFLLASVAVAKQLRVAVVDTGFTGELWHTCEDGSYDFINKKSGVGQDEWGHGTNITYAIMHNAGYSNGYCLMVIRVFGAKPLPGRPAGSTFYVTEGINYALSHGADVINLSLDGPKPNEAEHEALRKAARAGVEVFTVAGNDNGTPPDYFGHNLDDDCNSYPACYDVPGVVVVGSVDVKNGKRIIRGNYGHLVYQYEDWCYDGMCGTSQSTAIATGKWVGKHADD